MRTLFDDCFNVIASSPVNSPPPPIMSSLSGMTSIQTTVMPTSQTTSDSSGSWVWVIIALIVFAVIIAIIVFVLIKIRGVGQTPTAQQNDDKSKAKTQSTENSAESGAQNIKELSKQKKLQK